MKATTFRIMAAQPLEGMCFGSSSTIRSADGLKLAFFAAIVDRHAKSDGRRPGRHPESLYDLAYYHAACGPGRSLRGLSRQNPIRKILLASIPCLSYFCEALQRMGRGSPGWFIPGKI
jgi:hypothetical protein